jgi:hypothetical protein
MKQVFVVAGFVFVSLCSFSQSQTRLNFFSSYVFEDNFDGYHDINNYYSGKVKGGYQWGGSIEFLPQEYAGIELMYLRENTKAPTSFKYDTNPLQTEDSNVALNYIMLGGNGYTHNSSGKIEGYGGLMAGIVIADVEAPSKNKSNSGTNFAWGAKIGANFWMSDKLGIKLQAQVLSASRVTGGDVYFSWWGPVYLDTYSTLWQFSLGGGLTFRFGH